MIFWVEFGVEGRVGPEVRRGDAAGAEFCGDCAATHFFKEDYGTLLVLEFMEKNGRKCSSILKVVTGKEREGGGGFCRKRVRVTEQAIAQLAWWPSLKSVIIKLVDIIYIIIYKSF